MPSQPAADPTDFPTYPLRIPGSRGVLLQTSRDANGGLLGVFANTSGTLTRTQPLPQPRPANRSGAGGAPAPPVP